jgi:hypothetical protein
MFEHLITLGCDGLDAVTRKWLREQPAIVRHANELLTPDAFTCTTSTGSPGAALWSGDVPMAASDAVSGSLAADLRPLPRLQPYNVPVWRRDVIVVGTPASTPRPVDVRARSNARART